MNITTPITLTPPPITLQDGTTKTFLPRTLTKLDLVYIDDTVRKVVLARIQGIPQPLVLWKDEAYDTIDQWTDTQAQDRITELLGANPAATLTALFTPPVRSARPVRP